MDGEQISPRIRQTQYIEIGFVLVETALCLGIAQVLQIDGFRHAVGLGQLLILAVRGVRLAHMPAAGGVHTVVQHKLLEAGGEGGHGAQHGGGQDDANDGDNGAGAVLLEGLEGELVQHVHGRITSSRTILPSSMAMMRSAWRARDSS